MDSNHLADLEEKLILDTPPHILFLILPIFAVVVLWFLYLFIICPFMIFFDGTCLLVSGLTFSLLILVLFLDWINNRLILTNLKVTRQRGIIGKEFMTIGLDRIQDMKVSFGIFGRIFGFGALEIESAGTLGRMVFRWIPSPKHVKSLINKEIKTEKVRGPLAL